MKVLSLFGYIVPEEVKKLADKCQQYMEDHLDEVDIQKEYSSYLYSKEILLKIFLNPYFQVKKKIKKREITIKKKNLSN